VILTAGSRGDVQPYAALGAGLRRAGLTVRLATHAGFRELAESAGLEFAPVAHPAEALTEDPRWDELQRAGDTPGRFVRRWFALAKLIRPLLDQLADDHWQACQGADAVVSSIAAFAGPHQAAALGLPHSWALFQPMTRTAEYPHFMTPPRARLSRGLNARTYAVAERVHSRLFRRALVRWLARRGITGRPAAAGFGADGGPILYGISPSVVPRPDDWPPNVAQYGYWFLEAPGVSLPPELTEFLDAGPPPVFVHASRIAAGRDTFVALVVRVLARLGLRGLVSGVPPGSLPDSVLAVPAVPFDVLFQRVAGVVHHGGAGTTATAARAGVPSLGIPGFFDQVFWSSRVAALGAGVEPLPARRLSEERFEQAVARLVGDASLRRGAAALGERIGAEAGVEQSAAHLQRVFAAGSAHA
jgi:UDP:flavonoid glycosyltransferase YjiC (YdhE family)